jgi:Tfp pilus assembly protein PilE
MKKYAIPAVIILAILALVMVSYGQAQNRDSRRQAMRERFQNMSEEERAAAMARMRARGFGARLSREEQQKAVKTIEEQVAKLKAAVQVERPQGGFQNLSEEERNKLRQSFTDRRTALQAIITQVAALQGRRQPEGAENARFIIINTADLKPIQEMAEKEKATETSQLLARMASRGSGRFFGGRRPRGQQ